MFRLLGTLPVLMVAILATLPSACDDDGGYSRRQLPATGNEPVDEIIAAMLERDTETIERYWNELEGEPCFPVDEIGLPKCRDGEEPGTIVREGAFRCGEDAPRLEDGDVGVADDWDLYAVQVDDSVGLDYQIVFSPQGKGDERALELRIRTAKPGLEHLFDVSFYSYSETCATAAEVLASSTGVCPCDELIIPPPESGQETETGG